MITGAGGFIGSHLTERCVELGHDVVAFVRYNSRNNFGWLETSKYKENITFYTGDIRDYDSVYDALKGCDTVLHLAALIGIPYSYISPRSYISTNIEGTYNILQASKKLTLENILITSTSETYGTAQYIPIDEDHPLIGQSPYSASKIGADQLALSYYRSFNLPVKTVRPFNTYGPRQSARAIIPTIIGQLLNGHKEIKLGNTTPTRDLTFVEDTVEGFIEIEKYPDFCGQVVNIGMNTEISMKDLAELIAQSMNQDISVICDEERVRPGKSEVERLCCNNAKLVTNTPWRPQCDLKKGLKKTIDWMSQNIGHYKTNIYNY